MKALIPAAGLGTRFLPATKAQPKEMLLVDNVDDRQFLRALVEAMYHELPAAGRKGRRNGG